MNAGKIIVGSLVLTLSLAASAQSKTEKENDVAVPAFSDLPLLGARSQTTQLLAQNMPEELNPLPLAKEIRRLDINRDLQLNDFDAKQFQAIVESLNGEKLTGLELSIRFRGEQKNQRESFPILYDLDRDGMFTPYDVDYFTEVITNLDEGALHGNELIHKFKLQIFPQEKS